MPIPKLLGVLTEYVIVAWRAEVDILAFHSFPLEHCRQIWSTNALQRLNREVGRRCEWVGIFPNRPALLRLVGAGLITSMERKEFPHLLTKGRAESPQCCAPVGLSAPSAGAVTRHRGVRSW
jgi:transposase-like protein